MFQRLVI